MQTDCLPLNRRGRSGALRSFRSRLPPDDPVRRSRKGKRIRVSRVSHVSLSRTAIKQTWHVDHRGREESMMWERRAERFLIACGRLSSPPHVVLLRNSDHWQFPPITHTPNPQRSSDSRDLFSGDLSECVVRGKSVRANSDSL